MVIICDKYMRYGGKTLSQLGNLNIIYLYIQTRWNRILVSFTLQNSSGWNFKTKFSIPTIDSGDHKNPGIPDQAYHLKCKHAKMVVDSCRPMCKWPNPKPCHPIVVGQNARDPSC